MQKAKGKTTESNPTSPVVTEERLEEKNSREQSMALEPMAVHHKVEGRIACEPTVTVEGSSQRRNRPKVFLSNRERKVFPTRQSPPTVGTANLHRGRNHAVEPRSDYEDEVTEGSIANLCDHPLYPKRPPSTEVRPLKERYMATAVHRAKGSRTNKKKKRWKEMEVCRAGLLEEIHGQGNQTMVPRVEEHRLKREFMAGMEEKKQVEERDLLSKKKDAKVEVRWIGPSDLDLKMWLK